ncbi:MAG: cytidine deaminase [Thermacetogeniaceae bacterium]
MLSEGEESLLRVAKKASERAYAPYSGFRVGAALLASDGTLFTGCNIENASYGLTICAERVALGKAVSEGARSFAALAVWAPVARWPCGACLQCLAEFAPDLRILRGGDDGIREAASLAEIFPVPFKL